MLIQMSHGGGGGATRELIENVFASRLSNPVLSQMEDAALIDASGQMAYTTDSFVIHPVFFRGGDIGRLAVAGTVNDLLMMGARPRWLTAGFILEEGLPISDLERIVDSIATTAAEAGVQIVAGDTKVIEGKGGIYINTSGIGTFDSNPPVRASQARPGDAILVSGCLGDHHASILSQRMQIQNTIRSDVAPLVEPVRSLIDAGIAVHGLRDATRGGLTTVLNELMSASGCGAEVNEAEIPVRPETRAFFELLGLDALAMANEGKFIAIVAEADTERALMLMHACAQSVDAKRIGTVVPGSGVSLVTRIGGRRRLSIPWYEGLPRIC